MADNKQSATAAQPIQLDMELPEVKAAVARAVAEQIAALTLPTSNGDIATMNSLALALAELSGQGQGKTFVDPKVLKARRDAEQKMWELVLDAQRLGKRASYQLTHKVVLDHELVEPFWLDTDHTAKPTVIDWAGAPNSAMIPINETAKAIHAQFINSIGSTEGAIQQRSMAVTANGLVVHGRAVTAAQRNGVGTDAPHPAHGRDAMTDTPMDDRNHGLKVHHKGAPGQSTETHILGTIMKPAQEVAQNPHGR